MTPRQLLVTAMRWFRQRHPEYKRVQVVKHGWYGHAVMADFRHERTCVATVHEVLTQYGERDAHEENT